jgi:hypothetical protein
MMAGAMGERKGGTSRRRGFPFGLASWQHPARGGRESDRLSLTWRCGKPGPACAREARAVPHDIAPITTIAAGLGFSLISIAINPLVFWVAERVLRAAEPAANV